MEDSKVEQKEVKVVNYGFFYVVFKVLSFPFVLLWKGARFCFRILMIYKGWWEESRLVEKRKRKIDEYFVMSRQTEEKL